MFLTCNKIKNAQNVFCLSLTQDQKCVRQYVKNAFQTHLGTRKKGRGLINDSEVWV